MKLESEKIYGNLVFKEKVQSSTSLPQCPKRHQFDASPHHPNVAEV